MPIVVFAIAAACTASAPERGPVTPAGPPEVQVELARTHAAELDDDIGARPAGSQQEQAATVYLTAHLQQAGYVVFLDGVPVADLVRSTNVVARPPSGEEPEIVVVAAYDTPVDAPGGGPAVGLLLELARALEVAVPDHSVEFVALGAEHATVEGGRLGSRRLANALLEGDGAPYVVVLGDVRDDVDCLRFEGASDELERFAPEGASPCDTSWGPDPSPGETREVFEAAGFDSGLIQGALGPAGTTMLELLVSHSR